MGATVISKGLLAGAQLEPRTDAQLSDFAHSEATLLRGISFYKQHLRHVTFRGVNFVNSSFAKSKFDTVIFRKCTFNSKRGTNPILANTVPSVL